MTNLVTPPHTNPLIVRSGGLTELEDVIRDLIHEHADRGTRVVGHTNHWNYTREVHYTKDITADDCILPGSDLFALAVTDVDRPTINSAFAFDTTHQEITVEIESAEIAKAIDEETHLIVKTSWYSDID